MNRPQNRNISLTITGLFVGLLFLMQCNLFAEDGDSSFEIAPMGKIGKKTYKCVESNGEKQIVLVGPDGKEIVLAAKKAPGKFKKELRKINKKKKAARAKITDKKRRKKKVSALNEQKKNVKEVKASSDQCLIGELPLIRTDETGQYMISIDLGSLPPGVSGSEVELRQGTVDELTFSTPPARVLELFPPGIQLTEPGLFAFPLRDSGFLGAGDPLSTSIGAVPVPFPDVPSADNPDYVPQTNAQLADEQELPDENTEDSQGVVQFEFSDFAKFVVHNKIASPESPTNSLDIEVNGPTEVTVGETFTLSGMATRNQGAVDKQWVRPGENQQTAQVVVSSSNESWTLEVSTIASKVFSPAGKQVIAGPASVIADEHTFTATFVCNQEVTGESIFVEAFMKSPGELRYDGVKQKSLNVIEFATEKLTIACIGSNSELCKAETFSFQCGAPGKVQSAFFVLFIDEGKKVTTTELKNTMPTETSICPAAESVTTTRVEYEDLSEDLKEQFKPPKGKQAVVVRADIVNGQGFTRDASFAVFCEK